jgi:hypothetical protein
MRAAGLRPLGGELERHVEVVGLHLGSSPVVSGETAGTKRMFDSDHAG